MASMSASTFASVQDSNPHGPPTGPRHLRFQARAPGGGQETSAGPYAPKSPGTPLVRTTDPPTGKTLLFGG